MNNMHIAIEHYNKYNTYYMKTYGSVLQSYMSKNPNEMLAFMGAKMGLKDGDNVLDAGSGFGGPAFYFSNLFDINILGINIDYEQIMISNSLAKKYNNKNVRFKLHDFHELYSLSKKSSFDKIYFLESIGHCNDLSTVLKECSKVISSDGSIFIKTMFSSSSFKKDQPAHVDDVREFYGYEIYDEPYFKDMVSKSKFIIDEISEFPNMELNLDRVNDFDRSVKDAPKDLISNNSKFGWKNFSMKYIILKKDG